MYRILIAVICIVAAGGLGYAASSELGAELEDEIETALERGAWRVALAARDAHCSRSSARAAAREGAIADWSTTPDVYKSELAVARARLRALLVTK